MISTLSERRKTLIRSRMPRESAIERSFRHGALTREQAIRMCHDRRIETAERHDRGEHYGSANYSPRILRETPGATAHERQAQRRADQNRAMLEQQIVDRAAAKQPHAFSSGARPAHREGASLTPEAPSIHSNRKAA